MSNDQIIYDVAIKNGFTPVSAKLVVAQSRFETADYTSAVFRQNYNTSGMKFANQPLAIKGTLAPYKERSASCQAVTGGQVGGYGPPQCKSGDHYAKFPSLEISAKDKIERNFKITMGGVTPEQLKAATTPEQFADLLKRRRYYGDNPYGTSLGMAERDNYARGLRAKLLRVQIIEFVKKYKFPIGGILLFISGASFYYYFMKKKGLIK